MKITYRPEIDGLRAIAVGAVILYHAQITTLDYQHFKGGFIGVDIFFVISGYLITSIILRELLSTGSFSFKNFYERRARRILPALIVVMLVSLPFSWMYLLPSSLIDFSKSVLYSLGFSSNFYFFLSGQIYGAESGLLKPFLHTWSLSVEEQFYILFPIILFITFKYTKKYLLHVLIFGFIISLGLADWLSKDNSFLNFYILPTRGWEVLAGSLLAYFEITLGYRCRIKILNLILPSVGLILIGHSILFFNDEMFHPSLYTLTPIIGACLIIWFSNKNEIITRILSTKLFVGIGLISYSLYLWHYPIFAFSRVTAFTEGIIYKKLILAILILFLSVISYYFIEKPFRSIKLNFKKALIMICTLIIIIITFSTYILHKEGKLNQINVLAEKQVMSPLYRSECKFSNSSSNFLKDKLFIKDLKNCKKKLKKFILIIGDSHSIDIFNSISKISDDKEFIIGLTKMGCRPSKNNSNDCHYKNALEFIEIYKNDIKYIFFTHKGSYFLTNTGGKKDVANSQFRRLPLDEEQIKNTVNYLKLIKEINNNLIFIGPHLEPNIFLSRKNLISFFDRKLRDKTNYDLIKVDEKLKKVSKNHKIKYLSKIDTLDFKFSRDFVVDGNFTFSDTDHWNDYGEFYFGRKLIYNSIIKDILFP